MIWAVIISCIITSICSFLFLMGKIRPRYVSLVRKNSQYIVNRARHSLWYFVGMRKWQHRLLPISPMLANGNVAISLYMGRPGMQRLTNTREVQG
jgi:hypothetical protein